MVGNALQSHKIIDKKVVIPELSPHDPWTWVSVHYHDCEFYHICIGKRLLFLTWRGVTAYAFLGLTWKKPTMHRHSRKRMKLPMLVLRIVLSMCDPCTNSHTPINDKPKQSQPIIREAAWCRLPVILISLQIDFSLSLKETLLNRREWVINRQLVPEDVKEYHFCNLSQYNSDIERL